jgi:hypothetical protein
MLLLCLSLLQKWRRCVGHNDWIEYLSSDVPKGNVEYKLHLIHPSPARFARLVTQLKWRLLEGGGLAFYELGVADSGALVGLMPDDLSDTLDTLRSMAAELGARMVVVKEIEVVGMGIREQDAREFAKKRRDRDREKDKAVVKAKAKARGKAVSGSYTSTASACSLSTSSVSSIRTDEDGDLSATTPDLATPSSKSSLSSVFAISTPKDEPAIVACDELSDSLALFTMDHEPYEDALLVSTIEIAKTTATVNVPLSSPPTSLPASFRSLTKAEKRRITRDQSRAERQKHLNMLNSPDIPLAPTPASLLLGSAITKGVSSLVVDQPADKLTAVNIAVPGPPRMIIEAMIVRELDDGEAFLDFARV